LFKRSRAPFHVHRYNCDAQASVHTQTAEQQLLQDRKHTFMFLLSASRGDAASETDSAGKGAPVMSPSVAVSEDLLI